MEVADVWVCCFEVDSFAFAYTTESSYMLDSDATAYFLKARYADPVSLDDLTRRLVICCSEHSTLSCKVPTRLYIPNMITLTVMCEQHPFETSEEVSEETHVETVTATLEIQGVAKPVVRRYERRGREFQLRDLDEEEATSSRALALLRQMDVYCRLEYAAASTDGVDCAKLLRFLGFFRNDLYAHALERASRLRSLMVRCGTSDLNLGFASAGLDHVETGRPVLNVGAMMSRNGFSSLHNCTLKARLLGYEDWVPKELLHTLDQLFESLLGNVPCRDVARTPMRPRLLWDSPGKSLKRSAPPTSSSPHRGHE
jgi:hypothetical protein